MSKYDDINKDFPLLQDLEDGDVERFAHLRDLLLNDGHISASLMYGSFIDDHIPNYNVSVFVDGVEYKFCMGWIANATIIFHLALAPYKVESHKQIVDYIMAFINEPNDPN